MIDRNKVLENKVALITGGGSHMGEATAVRFGEMGARVAVAHNNIEDAQRVADQINAAGGRSIGLAFDTTDPASVEAMVQATLAWGDRIDSLFQAQYTVGAIKPALSLSDNEWHDAIDTNLDGTFYVCRAVLPHMVKQKSGCVTLVCSGRALMGGKQMASYSASKGGIMSLTKSLQWEVGPHGVTINSIAPGMVVSDAVRKIMPADKLEEMRLAAPSERLPTLEDIANFLLYLHTEGSWITGQLHVLATYTE
jgi:NAD(P)-dependent dehydrogenase (short-subunit alcohol dehydrogenase family)